MSLPGDRTLRAGETVYVVGRPEGIRRLETRAKRGSDASNSTGDPTGSEASTPNVDD